MPFRTWPRPVAPSFTFFDPPASRFFFVFLLRFTVRYLRGKIIIRVRIRTHIRRRQNILSCDASSWSKKRRICRATAEIPKFPCSLARTSGFSERGREVFCIRSTGPGMSGMAPPISILDSASRRKRSERTRYSSAVWAARLNCKTDMFLRSRAQGFRGEIIMQQLRNLLQPAKAHDHAAPRGHANSSRDGIRLQNEIISPLRRSQVCHLAL